MIFLGNWSAGHPQMMILCHAHFILRIFAQHTVILYFCLQHTATHKKTSLPLKNRAHPSTLPGSPRSRALRRTTAAQPCSPRRLARAGLARHAPRPGEVRRGRGRASRRAEGGRGAELLRCRAGSIRRRAAPRCSSADAPDRSAGGHRAP